MKFSNEALGGMFCVTLAGMCWGTTGTIQAFSPPAASSLSIGAGRVVFAGLALFLFVFAKKGAALFRGEWNIKGVLIAAFGLAAYQLTFFSAVRLAGVAVGTMVGVGSAPPIAGMFGAIFFKEKLPFKWYVATAMAITGCSLLVLSQNGARGGAVSPAGVVLALAAALSYSLEGVGLRLIQRDAYDTIAVVCALSGLIALPWLFSGGASWLLSPRGAFCMALLTFLSTVVPYVLFTIGVKKTELGVVYTLTLSEPLTAWFLSAVLLGERLSLVGLAGVAILFGGILLLAIASSK